VKWVQHAECGACGHRRAFRSGEVFDHHGQCVATNGPGGPGGVLDDPCPACGTTDPDHTHRYWIGAHTYKSGEPVFTWRYLGRAQPGRGYRVPHPDGEWPAVVQLPDIHRPDPEADGEQLRLWWGAAA